CSKPKWPCRTSTCDVCRRRWVVTRPWRAWRQDLGQLLAEQAQAAVLIQRALDVVHNRTAHYVAQEKERLQEEFPVLSLIGPWLRSQLYEVQCHLEREHCLEAHETALALCRERGLAQAAYFVGTRPVLPARAGPCPGSRAGAAAGSPPGHSPGRRTCGGPRSGRFVAWVAPRVLSRRWVTPYSLGERPTYVGREAVHPAHLHPAAPVAMGQLLPPGLGTHLQRHVPPRAWCFPVHSCRTLRSTRKMEDCSRASHLPRRHSAPRLLSLWRHISKSRTDFESQPDSGFVGKGLSRQVNRAWNYLVKGLVGTVLLVLVFPVLSLVVCLTSPWQRSWHPLWMPCVMLAFHLLMVLAYDFDSPSPERNRICVLGEAILWQGLVLGLLQPIAAAIIALVLCPIAAGFILLVAVFRWAAVRCWDALLFHGVIKRRARVPVGDSWMVTRVAGPGLSQDHLYQINPEQALTAFLAKVELEQLSIYGQQTEQQILEPLKAYDQFVEQCFSPFASTLARDKSPYRDLEAELNNMVSALKAEVDKRKRELQLGLGVGCRQRTRMTAAGLHSALVAGSSLAQHLLPQLPSAHWQDRGLEEKDWLGLAAQLYSETFSPEFLVPLLEDDVAFTLQVVDVDLTKYRELAQTHGAVDIDTSRVVHLPKGKIHIHTPYLDPSAFNPQSSTSGHTTTSKTKR
ncbi:hypothetical protein MTO96_038575, partial [Rhipicephalus appendiculatus]